jgi:hypothetical protein
VGICCGGEDAPGVGGCGCGLVVAVVVAVEAPWSETGLKSLGETFMLDVDSLVGVARTWGRDKDGCVIDRSRNE